MDGKYENGLSWPMMFNTVWHAISSIVIGIVLGGLTVPPVILVLLASEGISYLLLAIYLFLILVAVYAMSQVCLIAIAPTISHTVAQRYHPVAYFSVVSIASVLFYSIGLIGSGFIGQAMTDLDWWYACLEMLGIMVMSLVLIFPASFPDLGIKIAANTPIDNPIKPDELPEAVFGMKPDNWYDTRPSEDHVDIKRFNTLQVFNISGTVSGTLHGIVFVTGFFMEAAAVIMYFAHREQGRVFNKWWRIYVFVMLIAGGTFFLLFCISQGLMLFWKMQVPRQLQLFFEVFAIFCMVMSVITLSFGAGHLVDRFH